MRARLRRSKYLFAALGIALVACAAIAEDASSDDPYLWLEDINGDKALSWVRTQNEISTRELNATPQFKEIETQLLDILDSDARIPYVRKQGDYFYNFWRDAQHVRGVWRRTTLSEYRKSQPQWNAIIDLDALAKDENENWFWKGADCLRPQYERCLISLSRGGSDAVVIREFDLLEQKFVRDGFNLTEAKSDIAWRNRNSVYVSTDFGADSLTTSGYPRIVKQWRRGTPLDAAPVVFTAPKSDVGVAAWVRNEPGYYREFISREITAFTGETFMRDRTSRGLRWRKLNLPADIRAQPYRDQLLVTLRHDWRPADRLFPAGAMLAINFNDFLAGKRDFQIVFTPTARTSLVSFHTTKKYVLLNVLDNIRGRVYAASLRNGRWQQVALATPEFGAVSVAPVDEYGSDDYFLTSADFLTPTTLLLGRVGQASREPLKQLPHFFATQDLEISQHDALSVDGTRIPYFQVSKRDLKLDGSNATLLTGYGGFEISRTPTYNGGVGAAWLARGGVYVVANIRGGGEFGPRWHQAALRENRQRAFDDFAAVAQDLITRRVTSPRHLGVLGASNGGLLVGVMLTQHPDLINAVVCQSPLLDMRRYHKLSAGASWMAEYGDPDRPEDWNFIAKYSPYQNTRPDAKYPRVLFTTSTRDDRVHPGHARKMTARLLEQNHDALFYENIEGGHAGSANNQELAFMNALAYAFLLEQLQ